MEIIAFILAGIWVIWTTRRISNLENKLGEFQLELGRREIKRINPKA